jgi:[ribosomal protein S18]-alanine N-acetyltransferase
MVNIVLEPPSETIVRTATLDDITAIMNIENASFDWFTRFPEIMFIYYLRRFSDFFFVVLDSSESIVGYTFLEPNRGCGYVMSIAVHPRSRNQGYAELLLEALESEGVEKGLTKMKLDVRKSNLAAIELYKKLGFVKVHTKMDYYGPGMDALTMEKQLDK